MQRTFTLTTLQGETDQTTADAFARANQTANGIADDQIAPAPCDVVAVFTDGSGSRVELHLTDWADVEGLTTTTVAQKQVDEFNVLTTTTPGTSLTITVGK